MRADGADDGPRRRVGRFGRDGAEVGRARHLVRDALHSWGFGNEVDQLELAVSELVTNAIVHGDGEVRVELCNDGDELRLDVSDEGGVGGPGGFGALPRRDGPTLPAAPGGWGLGLVDRVSDRWGMTREPAHTQVWMVVRAAGRPGRG